MVLKPGQSLPQFHLFSIKGLGVLLDPLNGMPFHCWVTHPPLQWYAASTHLCTWAKKGKVE